jgi:integrase
MDECRARGLSEKTMRNWSGLINSVRAENGGTPARLILPPRKVQDRPIPSVGEIRMMLCLTHGTTLDVPFQLALLGMRRGEVCALEPSDIDADGVAHIHCSKVLSDDRIWITKDTPKTSASNRYVQLPAWLAARIREQGYVTRINPNYFTEADARLLKRYRLPPYRLHDCRHFFASYVHEQGIPDADILAAGGWNTPHTMRRVYRHAMSKNRAGAAVTAALNL